MDEIKHSFHKSESANPPDSLMIKDGTDKMSLAMQHMLKAFGGNYDKLLEGLDPNSTEALLLCRYLRHPNEQQAELEQEKLHQQLAATKANMATYT